jgi:hypothetical protein
MEQEVRTLKAVHVDVPEVPSYEDISLTKNALCDNGLMSTEEEQDSEKELVKKGMLFDSLDEVKFWFRDYSVWHHRPYDVVRSNAKERYTLKCQKGCGWGVWVRRIPGDGQRWKVTNVKQPHTCGSARPEQVHSQCTATYLGRRIAPIVRADPDTTVASLIESIVGFTNYRVLYGKAWRAKQHAMALLWGDWKEAYARVPRILDAISHFNPVTKWFISTGGMMASDGGVIKPVMQRVFWCFPQCVEAFKHCRPVISVDATFLTGKYKGALMIAVGIDAEDQLIPLAFALTERERNCSWSWFLCLVRRHVIGAGRQVCMISDRHQGLLNAAREHMEGYPPLVHRWCMRHFAANIWRRQKSKEVLTKLKVVCKVKEERQFEMKLVELEKILNEPATEWLKSEIANKSKWAQAFDAGGCRYGIMTTNISEVFNNVLKGIRAMPVSAIVEYTFHKCNY